MRGLLLDTSVLIGDDPIPGDLSVAISVVSIAELHFGVQLARDDEEQSLRVQRLGLIESRFPEPLPVAATAGGPRSSPRPPTPARA